MWHVLFFIFFFFSSRRRHTRYWRDWSSDVCSSDLQPAHVGPATAVEQSSYGGYTTGSQPTIRTKSPTQTADIRTRRPITQARSEERRVGKEGRSWWSPYH